MASVVTYIQMVRFGMVDSLAITHKVCEPNVDTFLEHLWMHKPLRFVFLEEQPC